MLALLRSSVARCSSLIMVRVRVQGVCEELFQASHLCTRTLNSILSSLLSHSLPLILLQFHLFFSDSTPDTVLLRSLSSHAHFLTTSETSGNPSSNSENPSLSIQNPPRSAVVWCHCDQKLFSATLTPSQLIARSPRCCWTTFSFSLKTLDRLWSWAALHVELLPEIRDCGRDW